MSQIQEGKLVFFLYSSDAAWVTREREKLIDHFVEREMRDENLLEITNTENRALKLANILPTALGELSTIPFLPDSRRVVVIHDLSDFLPTKSGSKAPKKKAKSEGKKSPEEALETFLERDLPSTGNILIFSLIIEPSRGQYINKQAALFKLLQKSTLVQILTPPQGEKDPLWEMADQMLARNTGACLSTFRLLYSDDTRTRIFREILRNIRFLTQAKVLEKLKNSGKSDTLLQTFMPEDKSLSLLQQPAFVQKKIQSHKNRFQLSELIRAMDRLLAINQALFPNRNSSHVPDARLLLETFLLELCEGSGKGKAPTELPK